MIKVSIIGSGNVAHHLIKAIQHTSGLELVQVYSRQQSSVSQIVDSNKIVNNISELKPADLYIISVTDDAISQVSSSLIIKNQLVVHTSGTKSIELLYNSNRRGVFYPLQTFSKTKSVNFSTIPICIEAENSDDEQLLFRVAQLLSESVYKINSEKRKSLHVAAVFVSNFVNHMYRISDEICSENNLPFDVLKPLIIEVADKINYLKPEQAQTGPAKRRDQKTIDAHLEFLKSDPDKYKIYELLTQSILQKNEKL